MPAPAPTKLDANQVLQGSYDEANGRLRVDAQITTMIPGQQEVAISHVDDSIKIGDGTDLLAVNADGSINVNISDPSNEEAIVQYSEANSVAAAVETTILTYTVPGSTSFHLHRVDVSGTNVSTYKVKINASVKAKKYTWWTKFNETFEFTTGPNNGLELVAGDIVTVTGLHNSGSLGDFNATLIGLEVS